MSEQPNTQTTDLEEIKQMLDKHIEALYTLTGSLDQSQAPNYQIHERVTMVRQWWIFHKDPEDRRMRTIAITVDNGYEVAKSDFLSFLDYFEEGPREGDSTLLQDMEYYALLRGRLYDCPDILPDKYCELAGVELGSTYGHAIWHMMRLEAKYSG